MMKGTRVIDFYVCFSLILQQFLKMDYLLLTLIHVKLNDKNEKFKL